MIVNLPTTLRLDGITFSMRPGQIVPAPVLSYWRGTGELARLQTSGAVSDETAKSGGKRGKPKGAEDAEPVREGESRQPADPE